MPNYRKPIRLALRKVKGREPVWCIRDGNQTISTQCFEGDVAGAQRKLEEYLAAHHRIDTRQRDLHAISLADVMMLYMRELSPTSPSRKLIQYHMQALEPFWGSKTLADVKISNCRKYGESRPVKPATVRRELKTLQAAINLWHRESPLPAIPRVTCPPASPPRERFLSRSEVARMLWACRKLKLPHVARFILIGVYTGTRHDAILKLRWNAGLSGGYVDLDRALVYRRGTAERETSKRRPPVKANPKLASFLRRWAEREKSANTQFVVSYNGAPLAKMKRAWHSVVKEAGLGRDVVPHTLRHTCATWLLWEGKTIWEVAGILGADASTIESVYGHHQPLEQEKRRA